MLGDERTNFRRGLMSESESIFDAKERH